MKELEKIIGKENVKYNEPMSKHTFFKVGGVADIFVTIDNINKLKKVLELDFKNITIVGNGSNLLVKDNGIRGLVIKYIANDVEINENIVKVSSGRTNASLANILLKNELSGFEFAAGIPGTIGGALFMNAGAYGGEMKQIVIESKYLDLKTNEIKILKGKEHKFEYRKSIFSELNSIILETTLKLEKGNKDLIENKMKEYSLKRRETQPLEMPSAGSTFKRGEGFITAKLIDDAGLKGYTIGDAMVSTKHAGFVVNKGNATAKDIINLINYIKEEVYKKFNIVIQEEVKIIGE